MNLNEYMEQGISSIAETLSKFYLSDREGSRFLVSFASSLVNSAKIRSDYEKNGRHIPPSLIASISSQCNLRGAIFAVQDVMPGQTECAQRDTPKRK